jgi:hypothetical protein
MSMLTPEAQVEAAKHEWCHSETREADSGSSHTSLHGLSCHPGPVLGDAQAPAFSPSGGAEAVTRLG